MATKSKPAALPKFYTMYFELTDFRPDPQQYKPHNPGFKPTLPTQIAIDVPEKYVLGELKEGGYVITPEGVGYITKTFATKLDRVYKGLE